MDYPSQYISHNWPLVVLFGLGTPDPTASDEVEFEYPSLQDRGFKVSSELLDVTGSAAEALLNCFLDFDAQDAAWNNRPGNGRIGSMGFTFRSVGRTITFPPHKAAPPSIGSNSSRDDFRQTLAPVLHSPISPLTPDSPVFPDGLMTSLWFTKHQLLLPSTLVAFFNFTLDGGKSTLHDNKLKSEINAIRTSITSSGYKVRLVVVLMTEDEDENNRSSNDIPDRLANIRKATSLDPKSLHLISRTATDVEFRAFVGGVLLALQPSCVEYYRDLSKHARRKRNRGSVPPPTAPPTTEPSQPLSSQGWTVRYETKMGYFAEFRQEMDAACRNYEAAYETLFDGEFLSEIAEGDPRFNEARLLADTLAIRILRCLLWTNLPTSAIISWTNHRLRMRDLIERRGKSTQNYTWDAWEARWATVMGEVIEKVDLPAFQVPIQIGAEASQSQTFIPNLFATPEKSYSSEQRLQPWSRLHHPGYWLNIAARHTRQRRRKAIEMSLGDQNSDVAGNSPSKANDLKACEAYLCPEPSQECGSADTPGFDHSALLVSVLDNAARHFSLRQQSRTNERLQLETVQEYHSAKRWEQAMEMLLPLWRGLSWRRSGWWHLVQIAAHLLRDCATGVHNHELVVEAEWTLLAKVMKRGDEPPTTFNSCIDMLQEPEARPQVTLKSEDTVPTFAAQFAFGKTEGNVGIIEIAQLSVTSNSTLNSSPLIPDEIEVIFDGGLKSLRIVHSATVESVQVSVTNGTIHVFKEPATDGSLPIEANLEFLPGQTKVFSLPLLPREAGELQAVLAKVKFAANRFDFELRIPLLESLPNHVWWLLNVPDSTSRGLTSDTPSAITILPKPPKIEIELPDIKKSYYISENIELPVKLFNKEEDAINVKINVSLSGDHNHMPSIQWAGEAAVAKNPEQSGDPSLKELPSHSLGDMEPGAARYETIEIQALPEPVEIVLTITADYYLQSDPDTPLTKHIKEHMNFIGPFESNYQFTPRISIKPWPSYFDTSDQEEAQRSTGLKQHWVLDAKIASFALEPLVLDDISLLVVESKIGATCTIESPKTDQKAVVVQPQASVNKSFSFEIQQSSLDDRGSPSIGFRLGLQWHREDQPTKIVHTSLLVPPLTVHFGEPRVLASASPSQTKADIIHLTYVLENPSTHFLSFSLTMETNEAFAFSGPKIETTQLVPLSKQMIKFNLFAFQRGIWIRPVLRILDTGFKQELHPIAADGCKSDKKGLLVWIDE